MHGLINVKSPNNFSEWKMGFNSAFKGLNPKEIHLPLVETLQQYRRTITGIFLLCKERERF